MQVRNEPRNLVAPTVHLKGLSLRRPLREAAAGDGLRDDGGARRQIHRGRSVRHLRLSPPRRRGDAVILAAVGGTA